MYKRRFIYLILCLFLVSILLAGCGNKLAEEAIDQGKLALASKEYDKALASFELAFEEGYKDENKEIRGLIKVIETYMDSKELFDEGEFNKAKEKLETIDRKDYEEYAIKEDIDNLKFDLEEYLDLIVKYEEVEELLKEDFEEGKKLFGEINIRYDKIPDVEIITEFKNKVNNQIVKKEEEDKKQVEKEEQARLEKEKKEKEEKEKQNVISVERAKQILIDEMGFTSVTIEHEPEHDKNTKGARWYYLVTYYETGEVYYSYYVNSLTGEVTFWNSL